MLPHKRKSIYQKKGGDPRIGTSKNTKEYIKVLVYCTIVKVKQEENKKIK